jgi:hypothetical protein
MESFDRFGLLLMLSSIFSLSYIAAASVTDVGDGVYWLLVIEFLIGAVSYFVFGGHEDET